MRLDSYRTRGSNGVNDVRTAGRWYLGGRPRGQRRIDRRPSDPRSRADALPGAQQPAQALVGRRLGHLPSRTASHRKRVSGKPPPESRP